MVAVSRTLTVAKPLAEVFSYLSDFTTTEQWDPGTVETTRLSGDGGLGTRYRNVSKFLGKRVELTYETTQLVPDAVFEVTGHNDTVTTKDHLMFATTGAGTEIRYSADFTFHGVIGKLPAAILRLPLERLADKTVLQMEDTLARL
ncbi:SRPBCC family protein [Mumia sp. ZJ1417]|uniref:SRPBCC family protein n=1 Tax=Mumia sp. ZJ1417 TaxID=2708082 RepID=UPI00141E1754|nr:SRPBCC family protein [Mumia sp. ZJ1417]QMW67887.1 SRPBCC family protein [Mumia sp. ZJ1417]